MINVGIGISIETAEVADMVGTWLMQLTSFALQAETYQ